MNFKLLKNKQGTTLIEVLVASAALIIGLAAILSSALAFLNVTVFSKNDLIASQMAREAIEVVRNLRDENRLNGKAFDYLDATDTLTTNVDQAIIKFANNPFKGKFLIEHIDSAMDNCITDQSCQLHFSPLYNLYGNGNLGDPNETVVNFYRLLTFTAIECNADTVFNDWIGSICNTGEIIGLEIKATVKWYKNSQLQSVEVADKLFDWQ